MVNGTQLVAFWTACQIGRDQTARAPMLVGILLVFGSPERSAARACLASSHVTEEGIVPLLHAACKQRTDSGRLRCSTQSTAMIFSQYRVNQRASQCGLSCFAASMPVCEVVNQALRLSDTDASRLMLSDSVVELVV